MAGTAPKARGAGGVSHRPCLGKGGPFARPLSLVAHEGLDLLLGLDQARRVPGTAHHGAGTRETGTCGQPERGARAREAGPAQEPALLAALVRLAPRDRLSPLSPGGPGGARSGGGGVGVSSRHSFDARALHRPTFSASPMAYAGCRWPVRWCVCRSLPSGTEHA